MVCFFDLLPSAKSWFQTNIAPVTPDRPSFKGSITVLSVHFTAEPERHIPHHLRRIQHDLRQKALKTKTKETYRRQINVFRRFVNTQFPGVKTEPSIPLLQWFICHLAHEGMKGSTVRSYVSALSYWSQDSGGPNISDDFHVKQLLRGLDNGTAAPDTRVPITLHVLCNLVGAVPQLTTDRHEMLLFQTMFVTAFFAFLRVGEMTGDGSPGHVPVLEFSDVEIEPAGVRITIRDYKHNHRRQPHTMILSGRPEEPNCPVRFMKEYLRSRGSRPGPLFVTSEKKEVRRADFTRMLRRACLVLKLDTSRVKSHSFRIGAAVWSMQNGRTDAQIRALGRWKSNAFLTYLRPVV
jgi:hypothetical protein